jgi:hypothetical protein
VNEFSPSDLREYADDQAAREIADSLPDWSAEDLTRVALLLRGQRGTPLPTAEDAD